VAKFSAHLMVARQAVPKQNEQLQQPPKTLPRFPRHEREWPMLPRNKVKPGGNFEFSGLVTETLLLGNSPSVGTKLNWDRANLKVVNSISRRNSSSPDRRPGWNSSEFL